MMKNNIARPLLLLAVFATFLAAAVSALECYQCHPTTNKNCSDINNARKIECRGSAEFCNKIVLSGEVTRDCYTQDPDEDHEVGCRTAGATTSCYCNSDGCNGAVTTHGAWKVLAAVAAVLPTAIGARMVL